MFVSCKGISDPTKCDLILTIDGEKYNFTEMNAFDGETEHFYCICNDFKLASGVSLSKTTATTVGLAVIAVTILIDNPNGNEASNNEGHVIVFDPIPPIGNVLQKLGLA